MKRSAFLLKSVPILLIAGALFGAFATIYYVNSSVSTASDAGPGSITQPWKTLAPLDNRTFIAGDSICFARGSSYSGGFRIKSSGNASKPLTFTAYGEGCAPKFTNANTGTLNGNVFQITGDYILIDSLGFRNCANSPAQTSPEILKVGAVYALTGADHITVKNCEFDDCPIGVYINGLYGVVYNNYFHDCNRFLSDPDWGPIAVVIGNAYAEISYNRCNNYIKVGGNYGADGGFIELDARFYGGLIHDLKIHHNISVGNQGFLEATPDPDGNGFGVGDSINIWQNVSDDFQEFVFWWDGNNSRMDNNTVIRTRPSTNGSVNTVFTMAKPKFIARNNIFVVANGIQVWKTAPNDVGSYGSVTLGNNLYYCTDGSTSNPSGKPLGSGEISANPEFVNFAARDYHLGSGSKAINKGIVLDFSKDIDGNPIPTGAAPAIGAYEYQTVQKTTGTISGTVQTTSATVNLTSEETDDWVHFTGYNHKSTGGSKISSIDILYGETVVTYDNDPRAMSWSDGTPTSSSANNLNGSYVAGINAGVLFTALADTVERTLKVYVGGWSSGGILTAHLSDNSATNYSDATLSGSGQYNGAYTLTYRAASANQTLTVVWKQTSGTGNVTIQGAALVKLEDGITTTGRHLQNAKRPELFAHVQNRVLVINSTEQSTFTIRVFNINGRMVQHQQLAYSKGSRHVAMKSFANGMYFYQISNRNILNKGTFTIAKSTWVKPTLRSSR